MQRSSIELKQEKVVHDENYYYFQNNDDDEIAYVRKCVDVRDTTFFDHKNP